MTGCTLHARMKDLKLKEGEDGPSLQVNFEVTTGVRDLDLPALGEMVGKLVKLTLGPTVDDLPMFRKPETGEGGTA